MIMKTLIQCKDEIARSKGSYANWDEYYNWISKDGALPAVVAQLIESATEESVMLFASQVPETGKHKPFIVANVKDILELMGSEDMSYSRGVEMFNEVAANYYNLHPVSDQAGEVYMWVKADKDNLPKENTPVRYLVDGKMKYFDSGDWETLSGLNVEFLSIYPSQLAAEQEKERGWTINNPQPAAVSDEAGEVYLKLLAVSIFDTMNDWCNEGERETIPRKALFGIAGRAARKIISEHPSQPAGDAARLLLEWLDTDNGLDQYAVEKVKEYLK